MIACLISPGLSQIAYDHGYEKPISHFLHDYLCKLIEKTGVDEALTMGEPGPDTIWAWALGNLGIKYILIIPSQGFSLGMSKDDKERYANITKEAKFERVMGSAGYNEIKKRASQKYMISKSELVIFVWNKGAAYTSDVSMTELVDYAKRGDKEIILVNPTELL